MYGFGLDRHWAVEDRCLDDAGEILFFEQVYFCRQRVGSVVVVEQAAGLEQGGTLVIILVDDMDGDARYRLVVGDDGFVYMMSIHAFSAIMRQQGRVDIDDAVGESFEEVGRHEEKESRQDDIVNMAFLHKVEHMVRLEEVATAEVLRIDAEIMGACGDISVAFVVDYYVDIYVVAVGKIFRNLLSVGAVAGSEYSKLDSHKARWLNM